MSKVSKWVEENKKFILKSSIFAGTSFLDYYLTDFGISKEVIKELNPLIDSYITLYSNIGPYLPKAVTTGLGIFAMNYADKNPDKTPVFKGKYIFYTGTILNTVTSLMALDCLLR
jgi:hypothetical protein